MALWVASDQPSDAVRFRSGNKAALDDLFVQVLGMLSAEGLISWERVTLDGTKIKASAGGNGFRRRN
jgi:transposase